MKGTDGNGTVIEIAMMLFVGAIACSDWWRAGVAEFPVVNRARNYKNGYLC